MTRAAKAYLGDGVYVAYDGFSLWLTAEDGIRATDTICLEPEVYHALVRYVAKLRDTARGILDSADPTP